MSEIVYGKFAEITNLDDDETFVLEVNRWLLSSLDIDTLYEIEFRVGYCVRDKKGVLHGVWMTEEEAKANV